MGCGSDAVDCWHVAAPLAAQENLAVDEMLLIMAELRACPAPPATSHMGLGKAGMPWPSLGGLSPKIRHGTWGRARLRVPICPSLRHLLLTGPWRWILLEELSKIHVQATAHCPAHTSLLSSPGGSSHCFCAWNEPASPVCPHWSL